jgi:type III pantothenate kinase
MNLIIDVGNTRVKIAVYNNSELIHNEIFRHENLVNSVLSVAEKFKCNAAIISFVGGVNKNEIIELKSKINLIILNSETKIPFKNEYASPKTLGVDRIALVSSAVKSFPNKNVLIIDAGTCITYDFVNTKTEYFGGGISPGLRMRYKALNVFTEKLPLLEPQYPTNLVGDSTVNSMHSGVINGVISEIDGTINKYKEKNQDLTVVLTGGDVKFLADRLKNSIFANPNFLLDGLNTILTYNL